MTKLTTNQIRRMFLDYFKEQGHMIEPGANLIPVNDPTLLWINSGVAALKKYFDGSEKPLNKRIANAQKAIRTNDITNVGLTSRHHTFFEMLGNFSIGDYFKKEAIHFGWEFLTSPKWLGLDKDKMYISVHTDDEEAYNIWINDIKIDPNKILKTDENYWQIGEGPSGPNSEIHYDRGIEYDPNHVGEKLFFDELENDRYIEVWNIVFSQYDAKDGVERKDYKELPQKNIDTGMGLERLVSIVQDTPTNYDIDIFQPLIKHIYELSKVEYSGSNQMAYRVICDHIRAVVFALSDGALFSNEGRGYILRRLLRRAVRYGKKLNISGSFLYMLVGDVVESMKDYYPELVERQSYVEKLVKIEEERFQVTLHEGEKLLMDIISKTTDGLIKGDIAFKLYDTYGFPVELTEEIAGEKGLSINHQEFENEMNLQKERARNSQEAFESMSSQSVDLMNYTKPSEFIGYDYLTSISVVDGLFVDGVEVDEITDSGIVIFDKTPFYGESGGQVGDTGVIQGEGVSAQVVNVTHAPNKQNMHHIKVVSGKIVKGMTLELLVDKEKREKIKANHSSVHLLQWALKKVVGNNIMQAGSYVTDDYSRFDFTHFEKINSVQLKEVEDLVNKEIYKNNPISIKYMSLDEAKNSGAMALFSDKYGDVVRVVTMGYSKELCGGTHVGNTSEIGIYKIISEESVGSGIRRIVAKTQYEAYKTFIHYQEIVEDATQTLGLKIFTQVKSKVNQLIEANKRLTTELSQQRHKLIQSYASELKSSFVVSGEYNVLISQLSGYEVSELKQMIDVFKNEVSNPVVFLSSVYEDKIGYVAYCDSLAISQGLNAGKLVKEAALLTGGNGGGRPDLAQAGGKDIDKLSETLEKVREIIIKQLSK